MERNKFSRIKQNEFLRNIFQTIQLWNNFIKFPPKAVLNPNLAKITTKQLTT